MCVGGGAGGGGREGGPQGLLGLMAGLVYFPCDSEEKLLTNGKLMNRLTSS